MAAGERALAIMDYRQISLFEESVREESEEHYGRRVKPARIEVDPDEAERQIREEIQRSDYFAKEYTVDELATKLVEAGEERLDDESHGGEFYIPYYQRNFVWPSKHRARFIESVLLELPIPPLLVARQVAEIHEDEGAVEIVDGSQRVRTLRQFLFNGLRLDGLERLTALNGYYFRDLHPSRQRKFRRSHIRVHELRESTNEATRLDVFLRINQGSLTLNGAEVRRGAFDGPFYRELGRLAQDPLVEQLLPVEGTKALRKEREELLLRYFAYLNNWQSFKKEVEPFLLTFVKTHKDAFPAGWADELRTTLEFVQTHFPYGFRKSQNAHSVPRVRFEAIAVGTALALREDPTIQVADLGWLGSPEFMRLTTADGSNSAPRLRDRIGFVRDQLLGR